MRIQTRTLLPVLAAFLAACGAQEPTPTTAPTLASSPTATAVVTETKAPAATTAPTTAPTAAPLLPSPTAPPTPTLALPLYNGVPHGITPDGFFFLGNPSAPVTLTDYSDFL